MINPACVHTCLVVLLLWVRVVSLVSELTGPEEVPFGRRLVPVGGGDR